MKARRLPQFEPGPSMNAKGKVRPSTVTSQALALHPGFMPLAKKALGRPSQLPSIHPVRGMRLNTTIVVAVTDIFFLRRCETPLRPQGIPLSGSRIRIGGPKKTASVQPRTHPGIMNDLAVDAFGGAGTIQNNPCLRSLPILAFANRKKSTRGGAGELGVTGSRDTETDDARKDLGEELIHPQPHQPILRGCTAQRAIGLLENSRPHDPLLPTFGHLPSRRQSGDGSIAGPINDFWQNIPYYAMLGIFRPLHRGRKIR